MSSSSLQQQQQQQQLWLRIIQINDVYELDQLASFKTCIAQHHFILNDHNNTKNDHNHKNNPDRVIVVLAGDFLAPSLLSSLDQGASMVDCLNAVGVDFVCFGNHECDVPTATALPKRIQQSNFVWINTNMQELNDKVPGGIHTPEYAIIQVVASRQQQQQQQHDDDGDSNNNNNNTTCSSKQVALLGLLTPDPSLYRPGSFANATIEPVIPTTQALMDRLLQQQQQQQDIDLFIPLTHQSMVEDREFADYFGGKIFPIVLGGHDHTPMDETTANGTRIFKTGYDAINTGIIDIRWNECNDNNNNNNKSSVTVTAKLVRTADYPPDPVIAERVASHQQLLVELEQANLFRVSNWMHNQRMKDCLGSSGCGCGGIDSDDVDNNNNNCSNGMDPNVFSTKDNRLHPSTGTTALTTMLRMGMRCHCALINAGSVRGNRIYANDAFFTWKDLKAEIPFPTLMTASYIPGHVLQDMITHSRSKSCYGCGCSCGACQQTTDPHHPIAVGGYIHTCTNICYNNCTRQIESIGGEVFEPNREYLTALPLQFFQGIDHHTALLDWVATAAKTEEQSNSSSSNNSNSNRYHSYRLLHEEAARPAKQVIVEVFCALFWLQLGSFAEMDVSNRGYLTRDDVKKHCQQVYGHAFDVMVENLMSVANVLDDKKDTISPLEVMVVQYIASDLIEHVSTEEEQVQLMKKTAAHVLGTKDVECEEVVKMVTMLRNILDKDKDGIIHRSESMQALGSLRRQSLLR